MSYHVKIPACGINIEDNREEFKDALRYAAQYMDFYWYKVIPDTDEDSTETEGAIVAVSRHFYLVRRKERDESLSPRKNAEKVNVTILTALLPKEVKRMQKDDKFHQNLYTSNELYEMIEHPEKPDRSQILREGTLHKVPDSKSIKPDFIIHYEDVLADTLIGHYKITANSLAAYMRSTGLYTEEDISDRISACKKEQSQAKALETIGASPVSVSYELYRLRSLVLQELGALNDYISGDMHSYDVISRETRKIVDTVQHVTTTELSYGTNVYTGMLHLLILHERARESSNKPKLLAGEFEL